MHVHFRMFLWMTVIHEEWKEVPAAQVSCGPAFTHTELKPTWLSTSSNHGGGGISQVWEGAISQVCGGHRPSMGGPSVKYGGVINQLWGEGASAKYGGVSIFPPVCTGSQNPQNYFSNTYVLPSVNRTAGPTIAIFWVTCMDTKCLVVIGVLFRRPN